MKREIEFTSHYNEKMCRFPFKHCVQHSTIPPGTTPPEKGADPIPNSAVKHSIADGSGSIGSARVGCRHFFPPKTPPGSKAGGVLLFAPFLSSSSW
jgi:hypothetical protein